MPECKAEEGGKSWWDMYVQRIAYTPSDSEQSKIGSRLIPSLGQVSAIRPPAVLTEHLNFRKSSVTPAPPPFLEQRSGDNEQEKSAGSNS